MPILQDYIHSFSHLHTDVNRQRWSQTTKFRAPHKPFLLLAVMDLFAQGSIQSNLIEITPELGGIFSRYWQTLMPVDWRGSIALPFFHLRSSDFWHLLPTPGKEALLVSVRQVDTLSQLQKLTLGARLDEDLFQLLMHEDSRNALRIALIQTYFPTEYNQSLLNQGLVNLQAYQYSLELLGKAQKPVKELPDSGDQYQAVVRDQGFRRAVVRVYDHRCAFCGVRMLTADGHSAVDAAHIIPWSVCHHDHVRNGLALCGLCHWTFDEGLMGISNKYMVLLSAELRTALNVAGHLLQLEGRQILGPEEPDFMPDLDSLDWHRHKVFRAT